MNNKLIKLSCLLVVILLLVGCEYSLFWAGTNLPDGMKASYKLFTGDQSNSIKLEEGQVLKLKYNSVVEAGRLEIKILDQSGQLIKSLATNQSGTYQLEAPIDQRYKVVVIGDKTSGKYKISWDS